MPFHSICSICSRREILEIVNAQLALKTPYKKIAAMVGVGKSSIHRHNSKCLAKAAKALIFQQGDDVFTIYANEPFTLELAAMIKEREARLKPRARLWIAEISYDAPLSESELIARQNFREEQHSNFQNKMLSEVESKPEPVSSKESS